MQTFFYRRDSWKIGICHIWVAVLALNLFHADVNIMAERDRLLRPDVGLGRGIKQDQKCAHKDNDKKDQNNFV
jgi:hypothetical protein